MSSPEDFSRWISTDEKITVDPEKIRAEAAQAAHTLIESHPEFTNEELLIWPVSPDQVASVDLSRSLLAWDMGMEPEVDIAKKVAYAREYLRRRENGIAE